MLITLLATSDGASVRRVQLRAGQSLKVGKSGWAEVCVPGDSGLHDLHFEVRSAAQGCVVHALHPDAVVLVNGEPIATAVAYDGDEVRAGASTFRLAIEGGPERPAEVSEVGSEPVTEGPPSAAVAAGLAGLVGVCAYLELGDEASQSAEGATSADGLIDDLAGKEKFQEALRLRAYTLERRLAVWWGCLCLRGDVEDPLPPGQRAALEATEAWVRDPTDDRRRVAEARAADVKYAGPGASLALSAFWSEGSIAPREVPDVEADERLTSQGVVAALVCAAYHGDPRRANSRFRLFLERGGRVGRGEHPLPSDNRR
ncbi:MAG: FHA domain-containing protein [Lacipirellulaceae bacterium]